MDGVFSIETFFRGGVGSAGALRVVTSRMA